MLETVLAVECAASKAELLRSALVACLVTCALNDRAILAHCICCSVYRVGRCLGILVEALPKIVLLKVSLLRALSKVSLIRSSLASKSLNDRVRAAVTGCLIPTF